MSAAELAAIAGVVLSLAFSYVPGLSDLYNTLDPTKKRIWMAVLLLSAAGGVFGLSCGNVTATVTCDKAGVLGLIQAFIAALVANQATYQISPKPATASA